MALESDLPPDLETRFTMPDGWQWGSFTRTGRTLRYGMAMPAGGAPDAVVVCLTGLSEFGEKYFETARNVLDRNMAFCVMDWMGQGGSERYLTHRQKRHGADFCHDVADLHFFIQEHIIPMAVRADGEALPMVMLAHSMGGNIGLQYLEAHPDVFKCAAFSAPMAGIKAIEKVPQWLAYIILFFVRIFAAKTYSFRGCDWDAAIKRPIIGPNALSTDPVRVRLHKQWFAAKPELQVGSPTYGWLYYAMKECLLINRSFFLRCVHTPCMIGMVADEHVVVNSKILKWVKRLPNVKLIEFPNARHEILMERDEIRSVFLEAFFKLVQENALDGVESLKRTS